MADYSIKQLAAEMATHYNTIYRAVESGQLPAYKVRGSIRIPEAEVAAYKAKQTIAPQSSATRQPARPAVRKRKSSGYIYKPGDKVVGRNAG